MIKNFRELYVVEYSLSQQAFNVSTVDEMLDKNCRMILRHHTSNDYLVIGIAETREEASNLVTAFRKYLDDGEFPSEISEEGLPPM